MAGDIHQARRDLKTRRPSQVYYKVETPARPARAADRLLVGVFLAAIWLPLAGLAFGLDSALVLDENRNLATCPSWSWDRDAMAAFPRQFDSYFNDQFGFRKRLIRWLSIAKAEAFGISSSERVVIGRDGWLFLAGEGEYDYYRATQLFSQAELERWAAMFQQRHDWLAQRGIRYLVVIPPNKSTIYPELMPRSVNRVRRRTRLDQLLAYLQGHTTVSVVDLREALLRAKAGDQLYHRTDSHWNTRGAHVGYQGIVDALSSWFPRLSPLPASAFQRVSSPVSGLDLANMLGLSDWFTETAFQLVPRAPLSARRAVASCWMPGPVHPFCMPFAMECDDQSLPRAVMFRDSFCSDLVPFLSEHFRRIVYAWKYTMDQELVERERPDVVIQELVERRLMMDIPGFREPNTPSS
ncbi:hypothetical protein OJF2_01190 [Aquisphaera giovannonii]|uniref:AlgX/AlgJ SGNH hydrolase-like domain-containing protein n=1 Tax=Aquisphaera giovannonii TaxID=406548 RepID=A0A5B9VUA3_9BACT|nr:hypothetical protein [Aquisphaera giovannonii]QEH31654.1 hypothetical protein OJF2_01190 [Aquisphaera giovannonii]